MKHYFHPWFRDKGCQKCGLRVEDPMHLRLCSYLVGIFKSQSAWCHQCKAPIPSGDNRIGISFPGCSIYICGKCESHATAIIQDMVDNVREPPQP